MLRPRHHSLSRLVLVLVAIALASCAGSPSEAGSTTTSTSTASTTTTTAPPTTTTLPPTTTTTSAATTTTAAPTTTTAPLPDFPPPRLDLEHGGDAWVVILAGSEDFTDPSIDQAVSDAADAGYETGPTDCDSGAAEALGLPAGSATVSVYLADEASAEAAWAAFQARGVEGVVALVQTFCLD